MAFASEKPAAADSYYGSGFEHEGLRHLLAAAVLKDIPSMTDSGDDYRSCRSTATPPMSVPENTYC